MPEGAFAGHAKGFSRNFQVLWAFLLNFEDHLVWRRIGGVDCAHGAL